MIDYMVVESRTSDGLRDKVLALISEGWRPIGGVSIGASSCWMFCQAMIKESNHE